MPYRTIFTMLTLCLAATMTAVVLMHDQIPRWQGWIGMGTAPLTVAMMGHAQTLSPARHA